MIAINLPPRCRVRWRGPLSASRILFEALKKKVFFNMKIQNHALLMNWAGWDRGHRLLALGQIGFRDLCRIFHFAFLVVLGSG